jgi:hypothetical protein
MNAEPQHRTYLLNALVMTGDRQAVNLLHLERQGRRHPARHRVL